MQKIRKVRQLRARDLEAGAELAVQKTATNLSKYGQGQEHPGQVFGSPRPNYELYPGE